MSSQLSIREALKSAGNAYGQNLLLFLCISIVPLAIDGGLSNLASRFPAGALLLPIGQIALGTLTSIILCSASLIALKKNKVSIEAIRANVTFPIYWQMLLANIVFALGMFAGMLLLIIPGIIFGMSAAFYQFVIIRERTTAIAAIKRSFDLTKGHRWKLWFATLAIFAPMFIIAIVLAFMGALQAMYILVLYANLAFIAFAHFYLKLRRAKGTPKAPTQKRKSA